MFITGLTKRFLNKTMGLVAGAIVLPLLSTAGISALLFTGSLAASFDAQALTIDNASWRERRGRIYLDVSGGDAGRRNRVNVYDADTGDFIDRDRRSSSNGDWSISQRYSRESQLPCRVRAERGSDTAEADVTPAPSHCQTQNTPPVCSIDSPTGNVTIVAGGSVNYAGTVTDSDGNLDTITWSFPGGAPSGSNAEDPGTVTYNSPGTYTTTLDATDTQGASCQTQSVTIDVTTVPPQNTAQCSDNEDNDGDGLIDFNADPALGDPGCADASDDDEEDVAPPVFGNQTDFKIMMNYELGMHCTGFEFAYCCVLPVYNSILAQVVKPDSTGQGFPELLEGDPNVGLDALGRETVVRDRAQVGNGFGKYVLRYWHDAQARNDGLGKVQDGTLISAAEGNSLMAWNTPFDSAEVIGGALQYGSYNGADGVVQGSGVIGDSPADNYQNAVWNHLYIYADLEGSNPNNSTAEADKIRLGVSGQPVMDVVFPPDCGAALHPLGPVTTDPNDPNNTVDNDCGGFSNGNVLTFSGSSGTVVYTQMKVLENLPIMLTSPDIWEALGLPLTPFEDSIGFFADPGLVNEDSVRPFVAMNAQLHEYDPASYGGIGAAVLDGASNPVIGFGTAPIDIPNCERCHSNGPDGTVINNSLAEGGGTLIVDNSPNDDPAQYTLVQAEYEFWNAYYNIDPAMGDSDWYSRLKSAAVSMLHGHDEQHGTSFAANYPGCGSLTDPMDTTGCGASPQSTRMGHEAVICQRCHADNVIAVVKSATHNGGELVPPITEAVHNNHRGVSAGGDIAFTDSLGRDGSCQGCHPAHRSDGGMDGYPITLAGTNYYANGDNRGASGGCFVGRDVHSNPNKDIDGAGTPEHLNAVGSWLQTNVASTGNGIWCTNCHNQLGQEMWKADNMTDMINNVGTSPRQGATLVDVAAAVGVTEAKAAAWLDPTSGNPEGDFTSAIWDEDPGLCDYVDNELGAVLGGGIPSNSAHDGNVATIEVHLPGGSCSAGFVDGPNLATAFGCNTPATLCGKFDGDGDFSVNILDFCTTPDCVAAAQATIPAANLAVPVPMSAATDGRDHWLAPGEPHCADCHAAPYVEPAGAPPGDPDWNPPFNYPRKASLMRYSKGHQGITCQGCHQSIHGLYPVTPNIDTTSYAQAAALNHDGSHGPLKCGTCHAVGNDEVPNWIRSSNRWAGGSVNDLDSAATWAHTYTDRASVLDSTCLNCHGVQGSNWSDMGTATNPNDEYADHADRGRVSRQMMDKAEIEKFGAVLTSTDGSDGVCTSCHGNEANNVSCNDSEWRDHLTEGRVSPVTFEKISEVRTGATCW